MPTVLRNLAAGLVGLIILASCVQPVKPAFKNKFAVVSTLGTGTPAKFNGPADVAVDPAGNLYVADQRNNVIRKIDGEGEVTTLAGNGTAGFKDGAGSSAEFSLPHSVAVDGAGNVYVADSGNNRIRKITPSGTVTTFAGTGVAGSQDGAGVSAQFNNPFSLDVDLSGNVYVADTGNNKIRKITLAGVVSTLAGTGEASFTDGPRAQATFTKPAGVAALGDGTVYVADYGNNVIRVIPAAGDVATFAGDGSSGSTNAAPDSSNFNQPTAVALDGAGNLYVSDTGNFMIREVVVTPAGVATSVSTVAGIAGISGSTDGADTGVATFSDVGGIAFDSHGAAYVADASNNKVRMLTPSGNTTTLAGSSSGFADGQPLAVTFASPTNLTALDVDTAGNVYVVDNANSRIWKLTPKGLVLSVAGTGYAGTSDGPARLAEFDFPYGLAVDREGNVYVTETASSQRRIRKITTDGTVTTLAGGAGSGHVNGLGTAAQFTNPLAITVDRLGNLYVTDDQRIRTVTPAGKVSDFAGDGNLGHLDGNADAAEFGNPQGVVVDDAGNVYVADNDTDVIRKISNGVVTTLSGIPNTSGSADGVASVATFFGPAGLALTASGEVLVADHGNYKIRLVNQQGTVVTVAGTTNGSQDGTKAVAQFGYVNDVAVDKAGNIYVVAQNNNVRKITFQ